MRAFFAILLIVTVGIIYKFQLWDITSDTQSKSIIKAIRLGVLGIMAVLFLAVALVGPSVEKEQAEEKKIELAENKIAETNAETKRKNEAKASGEAEELAKVSEEAEKLAKEQEKVTAAEQATLTILNKQFAEFGTFKIETHEHYKTFRMTPTNQGFIDEVNSIPYNNEAYHAWENGLVVGMVAMTTGDANIMPPTQYGTYTIQVASPVKAENNILDVYYGNVAYDFAEDFK